MASGIQATIGGNGDPLVAELQRMEQESASAARNIQQNIINAGSVSTVNSATAPRNQAAEYVNWWKKAFQERAEEERKTSVETASRSNEARRLLRKRAEARATAEETRQGLLIEQNIRDQAAVVEAQREEARRNIRARSLRRERAEAQALRRNETFAMGSIPANMGGGAVGRNRGMYAGPSAARGIGGASSAMFVSVARDSLASLASGASPITVFLQQAPQVGQAFTMMGSRIGAFLLPAGLAIAGITALGYGVAKFAQAAGAAGIKNAGEKVSKVLEEQRQVLRARVEALRIEREEAEKALQARREAARAGIIGRGDDIGRLKMENRVLEAKTPEEARKIKEDYLKDQMDAARMAYENTKKDAYNNADPEAQKRADEADLAFQKSKNDLLNFQKTGQLPGSTTKSTGSNGQAMLTDWEKVGGQLGGNNIILDVSKAHLAETRALHQTIKNKMGRGVKF